MEKQEQPIRVLEVLGRMDRGGAEAMIMNLYRKMDRSRVQLDFMVHTQDHCLFDDEIEQLGGHIYRVPRFKVYNFFSYKRAWKQFFKEHPEHRVIHGHMGATAAIYLHEANKAGRFTIAHSHSAKSPILDLRNFLYKMFAYPTRFIAKQLFGCSTEAGIERYGNKYVKGANYRNFPNAIDLNKFTFQECIRERTRATFSIRNDQIVIICTGRITVQKNPAMVFEIFQKIVKQDTNAICLWVGTGELEEKYKGLIKTAGLEDRIRMTGVRSDIPELLQAADAFLFPSLWEGLPVSVIEAQATGLPCVIADTISKEVEVSPLVEWHSLAESPGLWAERCLELAKSAMQKRYSPIDDVRKAGYDINETVAWLMDFYQAHQA